MITIRREQMKAFEKAFEDRFVRHAVSVLSAEMPEECSRMGTPRLRALAEKAVAKSSSYGISEEELILQFLRLQIDHGEDFDIAPEHAWASAILRNSAADQYTKMDQLVLESYARACLDYIRARKPELLTIHGERGFRDTISDAREKCRLYGIDLRRHGLRYLWLMCILGADFDAARETAWAGQILEDKSLESAEKIRRLEERSGMQTGAAV